MPIDNATYWKQEHNKLNRRVDKDAEALDRLYRAKLKQAKAQLESFYDKYAIDNKITLEEAKARLTPREFRAFNKKLKEWIKSGKYSDDVAFQASLEQMVGVSRIDRYQRLQTEIKANLSDLKKAQLQKSEESLTDTYKETENATAEQVDFEFKQTSEKKIRAVINSEFQGRRFSPRIWTQRRNLSKKLFKTLSDNFAEGKNWNDLKSDLKSSFGSSDYEARRLLITETARINSIAKQRSYSDAGFEHYQYIAVEDDQTTPICNGLNDKVFRLDEMVVGVNAPPTHVYCRSTTVPYFLEDGESVEPPVKPTKKPKAPKPKAVKRKPKKEVLEIDLGGDKVFNQYVAETTDEAKALIAKIPKPDNIKKSRTQSYFSHQPISRATGNGEITSEPNKHIFLHEYGHSIDFQVSKARGVAMESDYISKALEDASAKDGELLGVTYTPNYKRGGKFTREMGKANAERYKQRDEVLQSFVYKYTVKKKHYYTRGRNKGMLRGTSNTAKEEHYRAYTDIIDSITAGYFRDNFYVNGHGTKYYSKAGYRQSENFANLFSLWSSGENWPETKILFPNLTAEFERLMKEISK